ncbi:helix-turn-helix domain-containing protein [Nocardia sp. IBHARD005]|uniref:helix-turn-helix domain-containing protein n=1 Tax=Nocardia sp. IBHARD005 TaxID=3457765 RepID=UPI0040580280
MLPVIPGRLQRKARHTTFRYRLDPTVDQRSVLSRHAGAARFADNHCPPGRRPAGEMCGPSPRRGALDRPFVRVR